MSEDKLEHALRRLDPGKRAFIKKILLGTAFAVPTIASYSVKDLASAQVVSRDFGDADRPDDEI